MLSARDKASLSVLQLIVRVAATWFAASKKKQWNSGIEAIA